MPKSKNLKTQILEFIENSEKRVDSVDVLLEFNSFNSSMAILATLAELYAEGIIIRTGSGSWYEINKEAK
jgi:hypothetical protein